MFSRRMLQCFAEDMLIDQDREAFLAVVRDHAGFSSEETNAACWVGPFMHDLEKRHLAHLTVTLAQKYHATVFAHVWDR